ncbi:MAG: PDDEXK nuclease domain-containing protein [bacterium]
MKDKRTGGLYEKICGIVEAARSVVVRSVNTGHVLSNWFVGRAIVEEEQGGRATARYGTSLLLGVSRRLTLKYGTGYSVDSLETFRRFYLEYPRLTGQVLEGKYRELSISDAVRRKLKTGTVSSRPGGWKPGVLHSGLSWLAYKWLLRVKDAKARAFYEIEAANNSWGGRELERQIGSGLYERLALSRDKKGVLELAKRGQIVQRPVDILKEPVMLEFLDLPESERLNETELERALIGKLQAFLLELGQGFAFVGRQKRLTLDGDHFYPDLVFYHIKLKCYVIIELKTGKLTHGDLGQMLMYVNYYDREVGGPGDGPTIGLLLCTDKNEAVVKYVLDDKKKRIFASRYKTCLPSEGKLRAELRRELDALPPKGR